MSYAFPYNHILADSCILDGCRVSGGRQQEGYPEAAAAGALAERDFSHRVLHLPVPGR